MREIKQVKKSTLRDKVTQRNVVELMNAKGAGIYTAQKIHGFLEAKGFDMSTASVRNHLGKLEAIRVITKTKQKGLVAFEFHEYTTENWMRLDDEKAKLTEANRASMKSRESNKEKESKFSWGHKVNGVRVALKSTGTIRMKGA